MSADSSREQNGPVFVVGAPRSGTTIVAWALAHHSRLWTSGESYLPWHLVGTERAQSSLDAMFREAGVLGSGSLITAESITRSEVLAAIGTAIDTILRRRSRDRRWIDHTPKQTLILDLLLQAFPTARFIHVLRDGRRVVESMLKFESAMEPGVIDRMQAAGWKNDWMSDGKASARTWSEYVTAAHTFRQHNPSLVHTIHHEALTLDPESEMADVLAFLGEAHEPGPAAFVRAKRTHPSFQPGSDRTTVWTAALRAAFEREAGSTMALVGYK